MRESVPQELVVAIGLIWGHLSAGQHAHADRLARGCLALWPQEKRLLLMAAFARVELGEPLDEGTMAVLKDAEYKEWAQLVLRRADDVPAGLQ